MKKTEKEGKMQRKKERKIWYFTTDKRAKGILEFTGWYSDGRDVYTDMGDKDLWNKYLSLLTEKKTNKPRQKIYEDYDGDFVIIQDGKAWDLDEDMEIPIERVTNRKVVGYLYH